MLYHHKFVVYWSHPDNRDEVMKFSEFRRWLKANGVTFEAGKGSHFKITAPNGKTTIFADHGAKEMPEPTRKGIIKQLGL
ncbi:UNVERIFIED_CONTAM: hicA [Trichonephila clavipes]